MVDVEYDLEQVRIYESDDMLERYRDLIPIVDPANFVRLDAGNTPCRHARALGRRIGLENLFLKDETRNPTGTIKDRSSAVVLSFFKELGIQHFTSSATGNSSTSFAVACIRTPPFEHSIFVGSRWLNRLTFDDHPRVHVWVLEGASVTEAIRFSRAWERENGIPAEGGFFNLARREGLKLAFLEAVDQAGTSFDWYFQGVSTAMGVYAAYKGARQYLGLGRVNRIPRMGFVQEATCSPQVRAFLEGSPVIEERHVVHDPDGIADALLKGDPGDTYPYMFRVTNETHGTWVAVTAAEIRTARAELLEYEGIAACNASSTTIAAIKQLVAQGQLSAQSRVLANITGSDREPLRRPGHYHHVVRTGSGWQVVNESR